MNGDDAALITTVAHHLVAAVGLAVFVVIGASWSKLFSSPELLREGVPSHIGLSNSDI